MLRRTSTVVLAIVLGGALATAAGAQAPPTQPPATQPPPGQAPPGQAPSAPRQRMMDRFQQWLGLTDDQARAFQAAHDRQRDARRQLFMQLRQAQVDLRKLALTGGDAAAIQAKSAEVQQLLGQMVQLRVQALQEVAPILTPEQKEKLAGAGYGGGRWHHRRAPTPS